MERRAGVGGNRRGIRDWWQGTTRFHSLNSFLSTPTIHPCLQRHRNGEICSYSSKLLTSCQPHKVISGQGETCSITVSTMKTDRKQFPNPNLTPSTLPTSLPKRTLLEWIPSQNKRRRPSTKGLSHYLSAQLEEQICVCWPIISGVHTKTRPFVVWLFEG